MIRRPFAVKPFAQHNGISQKRDPVCMPEMVNRPKKVQTTVEMISRTTDGREGNRRFFDQPKGR